jgi:hypothetical protein
LDRCLDKGLHAFKRYCALGVLAANLHKLGNVLQGKARRGTRSCERQPKNVKKPYGGEIVCPDWSKIMGKRKK